MARGPRYNLPYRRRRAGKTDYRKRRALVLSNLPRLVVRPTNEHVIAQVIQAAPDGDRVLAAAHSSELKEFDWKGGNGNVPAAYLTGLLVGYRTVKAGVHDAILDAGLRTTSTGSRIFAALKGAVDSGLGIPHDRDIVPSEPRIRGEHIASYAKQLSSSRDAYRRAFSKYIKRKLKPEDLPSHFKEVAAKIAKESAGGGASG